MDKALMRSIVIDIAALIFTRVFCSPRTIHSVLLSCMTLLLLVPYMHPIDTESRWLVGMHQDYLPVRQSLLPANLLVPATLLIVIWTFLSPEHRLTCRWVLTSR